ncbi:unnamed protein product [Linum trigynum]|uniref:Uncharacterized protein n=1 Tax=Linum trigynum TaxID=586398 RepID=A0AAV2F5N7_9ROSI
MGFINLRKLGLVICVFLTTAAVVSEVGTAIREFSPELLSCCKPPKYIRCCCCLPSHANYTSAAEDSAAGGNGTDWLQSLPYNLESVQPSAPGRAAVPKVGV